MEFLSVLTKEQSYSLPHSTTFPEQQKFSLYFWPICKSRKCLLSKILPHTHCNAGSFIDFRCASFGAAPVPVEAGSVETGSVEVPPIEVEATAVCDLVVICNATVAMVVVVVVTVVDVILLLLLFLMFLYLWQIFWGKAHRIFEKEESAFMNDLLLLYHCMAMQHFWSVQFQQYQI